MYIIVNILKSPPKKFVKFVQNSPTVFVQFINLLDKNVKTSLI